MTRKEAFAKISKLLFGEQQFEQAKLSDGTVVVWEDELQTGTPLFVIDEAGTQQPAPDGEHTLEDGTIVTTAGGLVVTVTPKEQEQEVEVEAAKEDKKDEMAGEMEMMVTKLAEKVAELEAKIEEMGKKETMSSDEVEAKVSEVKSELENKFAAIRETVEAIASEPAAPEAQPVKSAFKKERKSSIEDLARVIHNIKK